MHTKYPLSIDFEGKNDLVLHVEKVEKNLRTISKPYAYLQTMTKHL